MPGFHIIFLLRIKLLIKIFFVINSPSNSQLIYIFFSQVMNIFLGVDTIVLIISVHTFFWDFP